MASLIESMILEWSLRIMLLYSLTATYVSNCSRVMGGLWSKVLTFIRISLYSISLNTTKRTHGSTKNCRHRVRFKHAEGNFASFKWVKFLFAPETLPYRLSPSLEGAIHAMKVDFAQTRTAETACGWRFCYAGNARIVVFVVDLWKWLVPVAPRHSAGVPSTNGRCGSQVLTKY